MLREGDLFPTALCPERQVWEHTNPEMAAALRGCTIKDGLAVHRRRHHADKGRITDYRLNVAKDALLCRLRRRV